jgi:hypothetical protein
MNTIKGMNNRIIVSVDMEYKNHFKLTDDVNLKLMRDIEQFDGRIKSPVNAIVISGEGLEAGWEILIGHNCAHPTHQIHNHGLDIPVDTKIYSLSVEQCFIYRENKEAKWKPCKGFLIVERIFKPYTGILLGIPPTEIKNALFVTSGNFLHQVLLTGLYCDYTIVFQEANGRESHITRMRDAHEERDEALAISHSLTDLVLSGELLIGETAETAKKFELPTVE